MNVRFRDHGWSRKIDSRLEALEPAIELSSRNECENWSEKRRQTGCYQGVHGAIKSFVGTAGAGEWKSDARTRIGGGNRVGVG